MLGRLERIWAELAAGRGGPAHKRVDESHPLDFYAGVEADGSRELLLLCDSEPPTGRKFRAFDVVAQRRQDGRWALVVKLLRSEFARLFSHLCEDLVEATRQGCSRAEAPVRMIDRLERWQRLFDRDRTGLLDDSSLRGLVGELFFLSRSAIPAVGRDASVEAWVGPLDAEQDFRFSDRLIEIKTSGLGQLRVRITSVEQLDVSGSDLYLSVAPIEGAPPGAPNTISVAELIEEVRSKLSDSERAKLVFEDRLMLAGYSERPEYRERSFSFRGFAHFRVTDGFPRIRRQSLHAAVRTVWYELDLAGCDMFRCVSPFDSQPTGGGHP